MIPAQQPAFGLWPECPKDVPVAWGARAIVDINRGWNVWTKKGSLKKRITFRDLKYQPSLVYDRQSWVPEDVTKTELCKDFKRRLDRWLRIALERAAWEMAMHEPHPKDRTKLGDYGDAIWAGPILEYEGAEVSLLHSGDGIEIKGSCRQSYGYLYLIAYPTAEFMEAHR